MPDKSVEEVEQGSFRRFIATGKETVDSSCKMRSSDFILGKSSNSKDSQCVGRTA